MRTTAFVVALLVGTALAQDVILRPLAAKRGQPPAALVFGPGASITPESYIALAQEIQKAAPFELWVAVPYFVLGVDIVPAVFAQAVARVRANMSASGLSASAVQLLAGHSMGAAAAQAYVASHPTDVVALASLGASLARMYNDAFPTPVLSIVGELDGLQRLSRVAECYFRHVSIAGDSGFATACAKTPVVVVEGSSHMQVATGAVPPVPTKLDLRPEIADADARSLTAAAIAQFFAGAAHPDAAAAADAREAVQKLVQRTGDVVAPLIAALEKEGSYYLRKPCNSDTPSPQCPFYPAWPPQKQDRVPSNDTTCQCGCPWVMEVAQIHIGGADQKLYPFIVRDAFHDVTDTKPYHHAHIWNDCFREAVPCALNITTVSQLIYDSGSDADSGFTHDTALEIRVKMKSRQAATVNTTDRKANVTITDAGNFCAEINQMSFDWAMQHAGAKAQARFAKFGQRMVFGKDITSKYTVGPLWIYNPLKLKDTVIDGETVLQVRSPAMITDIAGSPYYPDSNGYHYCKLLSPARAMEWIYTDGLRLNMGIHN